MFGHRLNKGFHLHFLLTQYPMEGIHIPSWKNMHAKITHSHQFTLKYDPHTIPKTNNFLLGYFLQAKILSLSIVELNFENSTL